MKGIPINRLPSAAQSIYESINSSLSTVTHFNYGNGIVFALSFDWSVSDDFSQWNNVLQLSMNSLTQFGDPMVNSYQLRVSVSNLEGIISVFDKDESLQIAESGKKHFCFV
jgi:hypothetical protein